MHHWLPCHQWFRYQQVAIMSCNHQIYRLTPSRAARQVQLAGLAASRQAIRPDSYCELINNQVQERQTQQELSLALIQPVSDHIFMGAHLMLARASPTRLKNQENYICIVLLIRYFLKKYNDKNILIRYLNSLNSPLYFYGTYS